MKEWVEVETPNGVVLLDSEDFERLDGAKIRVNPQGYPTFGRNTLLHHWVLGGPFFGKHIDHRFGNKLDARKSELVVTTPQGNQVNRRALNRNNTSGHRGVAWVPRLRRWVAQIMADRRAVYLGSFEALEDAIAARRAAELEYFGGNCP